MRNMPREMADFITNSQRRPVRIDSRPMFPDQRLAAQSTDPAAKCSPLASGWIRNYLVGKGLRSCTWVLQGSTHCQQPDKMGSPAFLVPRDPSQIKPENSLICGNPAFRFGQVG